MRFYPIPLMAVLLLLSFSLIAQQDSRFRLLLKSGTIIPEKNIDPETVSNFNRNSLYSNGKASLVIQFERIPGTEEKSRLKQAGIELIDYLPEFSYTAIVTGTLDYALLQQVNARAVMILKPEQKMQPELAAGQYPAYAVKVAGTVDVWINFSPSFSFEEIKQALQADNFDLLSTSLKDYRIIEIRAAASRLFSLAAYPFVEYVQVAPGEDKPLSQFWTNWGKDAIRSNILGAPLSVGGKNLKGAGVTVGVGDNADPQLHIDFTNRLIAKAAAPYNYHGTHVSGITGGAGIRNELRTGMAPKSTILSQVFSQVFTNAAAYTADHGMVITNNSYYNGFNQCNAFGYYDAYSRLLDQQAALFPNLQHVFAAGNSGLFKCSPMPDSFRTVHTGYQTAKNVLTVANASPVGGIWRSSSRGPVRDGRLKPEIAAVGTFITATAPPPFDYYWENTGTSMASPAIAGGLALLYERYRQLNGNANPKNGLIKSLTCNSGTDFGNPGPDYTFGFGMANFVRAVDMIENNRYVNNTILAGPTPQTIPVNVPGGLGELKVLLYWNDPAAAPVTSLALVNNLDLEVVDPVSNVILPLVLDTIPSNVKNNAVNGVDNINNIEQVVIRNPAAGNYTIRIKPTNIAQGGSQEYFLVYDFVPLQTRLTTPIGGEAYIHGENVTVRWDSYGLPDNNFTLEFSSDNGANWTLLNNNIPADKREYFIDNPDPTPDQWFIVPQVNTDQALMRISRNGTVITHTTLPFVVHDTITAILSSVQCEGYFSFDWNSIPGATGYEVFRLMGDEMVSVATLPAATLTYTFSGLSKDSVYWASVRPLMGVSQRPGRRAISVSRKPDNGTCTGSISDNDLKLDAILSPFTSGRLLTSTALSNIVPVTIRIKNLDDVTTSGNIRVRYNINGGAVQNETISNPNIVAGGTLNHTFGTAADLSAAGTYIIKAWIVYNSDPVQANDTLYFTCRQLPNPAITGVTPTTPFIDNFDAAPDQTYTSRQIGFQGLDRFDFVNSSVNGRIRTFINSGMAFSGNRAITLDSKLFNTGNVDSLTGTFNLATYNTAVNDLRLDFRFKNHGQSSNAANKVWIRGNDQQNWIEVFDLAANQNPVDGSYKLSSSIELSDWLQNNSQNFSSSFQVRWGQYGQHMAADNDGAAGYSFDDVRFYEVTDDMQLISIDTPIVNSCSLSANTPVKITVRNSSNSTLTNIPVRFRVNGGSWITESILSVASNANFSYTFAGTANLSGLGSYLLEAEVDFGTDNYFPNDTLSRIIINSPVITVTNASPYLQNFESSSGNWYASGTNSSWEYGTPASYKIKRAASGSNAWKTRLAGNYNDKETSYLYSPCFDISTLSNATLSFSTALDFEDCGASLCDGAYIEYSTNGINWSRLGANGQGTNWYNKAYSGNNLWSIQNYHRWHVATIPLSVIPAPPAQLTQLRFRFVMSGDESVNSEGIAVDDIHIYSNPFGIYDGATMGLPVTQTVNGDNNWVDFLATGKLIASVKSPVTALGSTDAQAYINTASVRIASNQYYHDRNITIKPATTTLADSAIVRFYFLDSETERLINATGCGFCSKPAMAYELGVTKYTNANKAVENGTLSDNPGGIYHFIIPAKITMVPFDKGYYAEFKANDFSEFWLNNGGINGTTSLPLKLLSFTARKQNNKDVLAEWVTTDEVNVDRFELEVARGNDAYQQNLFSKIAELPARNLASGQQFYSFEDKEPGKNGVRYYRLKMIDQDGSFKYSPVRPVVFAEDVQWLVYPNPSPGLFHLSYQLPEGEVLTVTVYDAGGKTIQQFSATGTGFVQKLPVDIKTSGLYMLEATGGGKKQYFKLLKQ